MKRKIEKVYEDILTESEVTTQELRDIEALVLDQRKWERIQYHRGIGTGAIFATVTIVAYETLKKLS